MHYVNRYNRKPAKPNKPADNADYDDIGQSKTAGQYHYNQKRKLGRF